MTHDTLIAFLSGSLSPEALAEQVATEVAGFYADLRTTKHAFIDISDGSEFVITKAAARRLLEAVAARRIPQETAVYVADCIVASESIEFADQAVRDAVFVVEAWLQFPKRAICPISRATSQPSSRSLWPHALHSMLRPRPNLTRSEAVRTCLVNMAMGADEVTTRGQKDWSAAPLAQAMTVDPRQA